MRALLSLVVGLLVLGSTVADAAKGPTLATPPGTPTSEPCRVVPRSAAFFQELATTAAARPPSPTASPAPLILPEGDPVTAETVVAITATMEAVVACSNAGDFARTAALFTDDFWRREVRFAGAAVSVANTVASPPAPVSTEQRERLVDIWGERILPDGRVGALVVLSRPSDAVTDADFVVFEKVNDRWLVDEVITGIAEVRGTPEA